MKNFYLPFALALTLGLAGCSSDDTPITDGTGNIVYYQPTKASKVEFYSNDHNLSSDPNVNIVKMKAAETAPVLSFENVETPYIDRLAAIAVYKLKLDEGSYAKGLSKDFVYWAKDGDAEFTIYPLGGSSDRKKKKIGVYYYDEAGVMHTQILWDAFNIYDANSMFRVDYNVFPFVTYSKGLKIKVKHGYKFGFFWDGTSNFQKTTIYSGSNENNGEVYAGTFKYGRYTYLCTEDWKNGDADFQDLVFLCDGKVTITQSSDTKPSIPETSISPETPITPDKPVTPDQPAVSVKDKHVEVNLAVNDVHEKGDWIESHLSIHLRDITDAEIFLPVPAEYYCPEDDMMIVQKHDEAFVYNTKTETASMTVAGKTVILNVKYEANGIRVTTDGMCKEILDYCQTKYSDGLTFEVRNYYNNAVNRTQLIEILNKSTVKFLDADPEQYIYAKGIDKGVADKLACTVKPLDTRWSVTADGNGVEKDGTLQYIYEKNIK